jgi:peptidoglycan/LPS O-acetylase OafA/YrhL
LALIGSPTVASRTSPSAKHIPALDGLRGIAVLTVMLLHFNMLEPAGVVTGALSRTFSIGWIGVDLFFVLSGFLITGILYDAKGATHYFRNFYLRRSLRIFPLYYAYLFAILIVLPLVRPGSMTRLEGDTWLWTYLSNVLFARAGWEGMPEHTIHLWSLAIEEQFYLLWPLVVFFCDRSRLIKVALATIIGATVFRVGSHFFAPDGIAGYALLPSRVDALALGGILAMVIRGEAGTANAAEIGKRLLVPGLALISVAVVWSFAVGLGESWMPALALQTQSFGYPGVELVSAGLIMLSVSQSGDSAFGQKLTWQPLMTLGKYSYGLYLMHVPVRDFIRVWFHDGDYLPRVLGSQVPAQLAVYAAGIGLSMALALISWHAFEKHFLKLKVFFPYAIPPSGDNVRPDTRQERVHRSQPQINVRALASE